MTKAEKSETRPEPCLQEQTQDRGHTILGDNWSNSRLFSSIMSSSDEDDGLSDSPGEEDPLPPPAIPPPPPRRGRPGSNYCPEETDDLLSAVELHLPIGNQEWERVKAFMDQRWLTNRSVDSLKQKFGKLWKKKVPTGDPNCPPQVKRAKRLNNRIIERSNAVTDADTFGPDPLQAEEVAGAGEVEDSTSVPETVRVPENTPRPLVRQGSRSTRSSRTTPGNTNFSNSIVSFMESRMLQMEMEREQARLAREEDRRVREEEQRLAREESRLQREQEDRRQEQDRRERMEIVELLAAAVGAGIGKLAESKSNK